MELKSEIDRRLLVEGKYNEIKDIYDNLLREKKEKDVLLI